MTDRYQKFVASKVPRTSPRGLTKIPTLASHLFPFQRDAVEWALRCGQAALFEDCGLGKTVQQLECSRVVGETQNTRALILAPLAVAKQTVREATKFGYDARYAKNQDEAAPRGAITVTNYERLAAFDPREFGAVTLDESGILKAYMGKTRLTLQSMFAGHRFKFACSATPAPNDHLELGTHCEWLDVLTSHEMIARYFLPDTSTFGTYRLRRHGVKDFWDWVSSWALCISKPSDLGYDDAGYVLPEFREHRHVITVDAVAGRTDKLYRDPEMSATKVHEEKRRTAPDRARKTAEIITSEPSESWIVWVETDYEDDAVRAVLPGVTSLRGSDKPEDKERKLEGFLDGSIRWLMTKPKLGGFGLNWQHCARNVFPATFSYESYYQASRRTLRFGQTRPVDAHMVVAHTELDILSVLARKRAEHHRMQVEMFAATRRAQAQHDRAAHLYEPKHVGRLPAWLEAP